MEADTSKTHDENHRSRTFLVILCLVLIGSPGSLLLFALPLDVTPILLLLVIPLTLAFVLWYRRILTRREAFRQKTGLV